MQEPGRKLENFIKAGAIFLGVLLLVLSVSSFNVISNIRDYLEKENARRLTGIAEASARELQEKFPESVNDPYYIYSIKLKQSLAGAALLDRNGNTVFDPNNNYKKGEFPSEISVSRLDIESAWKGKFVVSPIYKRKGAIVRSVYFPVKDGGGTPALVGEITLDAGYIDELTQQSTTYSFIKGMAGVFLVLTVLFVIRSSSPSRKRASEKQGGRDNVSFVVDTFHSLVSQLKEKEKELQELKDKAEERARAVESYNESVLRNIQTGVMTFGVGGDIITANAAAGKILDLSPMPPAGAKPGEIFGGESWIAVMIEKTLSGGKPERRGEGEVKLKSGETRWLGAGVSPLLRDGALEGAILVFTDITEVKELRERMEMKERIAVLGEMSAGIAHELRNPMGVISGYSEYLARKLKEDAELNEAVESIRAEIRTMDEIIREFMNFSQPTELNITEVDINAVIEEALRAVQPVKEIAINIEKGAGLPQIGGDGVLLRQAFLNIIKNAMEAMPGGGELKIKTELAETGRPDSPAGHPRRNYIKIQISDTGEGIEEKALKKIFMPFFTTKAKGTGLGLALVQKILVYHGGRVSVRSARGKGTAFIIYMPIKPEGSVNV